MGTPPQFHNECGLEWFLKGVRGHCCMGCVCVCVCVCVPGIARESKAASVRRSCMQPPSLCGEGLWIDGALIAVDRHGVPVG